MKEKNTAIKASTHIATLIAVFSSLLLVLLILLSLIGVFVPREVRLVIHTADASKMYDGKPLSADDWEITYGALKSDHTIVVTSAAELTHVGQIENTIDFVIQDKTGADVTNLYRIDLEIGTLTVTPKKISFSTPKISKVYDGTPLKNDQFSQPKLAANDKIMITSTFSETEVGTYENKIEFYIADQNGSDVTDQYEISYKYGKAEINGKAITISTGSQDSLYTGKPVSNNTWKHTAGTLFEGDTLHVTCNASLTEVGSVPNTPTVTVLDANGSDVTNHYDINLSVGTLTVNPIPVVITTGSSTKVYDGTPLSNTTWSVSGGGLISGDKLSPISFPSPEKVGITNNKIVFSVKDSAGIDVTSRYDISCVEGTLTIQPRPLSVLTGSARQKYNGNPLMSNQFTITHGSLCAGESASFVGAQQTEIGYTQNIPTKFEIYKTEPNGTKIDVSSNYIITYTYGTLTVIN